MKEMRAIDCINGTGLIDGDYFDLYTREEVIARDKDFNDMKDSDIIGYTKDVFGEFVPVYIWEVEK